jgi:outer membrane receptor protein involved in Fe transport
VVVPNERTVLKAMFTVGVARQINAAATGPPAISLGIPITYTIQDAEKMYSYELSGSYKVNSNLDFSLNVFYNSLRDIFGLDPAQLPAQIVLISGGRIDYVGFEAIANVDLTPDASVRFVQQHVQFASTVDDPVNLLTTPDDEHPYNYPENVTKLLVDTRLMRTVTFNANANLVWNTYAGTAANIAGGLEGQTRETGFYALVNANLLWTIRPELELMFSGYNLLNTRETVPPFTAHAELAERNFNVSLAVKF